MSAVLVTGATQPLGRMVINELLLSGKRDIIATGIEKEGELAYAFPEGVQDQRADLSRARSVRKLMMGVCREREVGCVIGSDYPAPIVEHKFARERALAFFKAN